MTLPPNHTPLHWSNLGIHVLFGAAALGFGLAAICSRKGSAFHIRSGRLFLYAYLIVILTAIVGLLAFDFRSFLAVVTLLSFYDAFAGYRAPQLRGRRPQAVDRLASIVGLLTPWIFIAIMRRLHPQLVARKLQVFSPAIPAVDEIARRMPRASVGAGR